MYEHAGMQGHAAVDEPEQQMYSPAKVCIFALQVRNLFGKILQLLLVEELNLKQFSCTM